MKFKFRDGSSAILNEISNHTGKILDLLKNARLLCLTISEERLKSLILEVQQAKAQIEGIRKNRARNTKAGRFLMAELHSLAARASRSIQLVEDLAQPSATEKNQVLIDIYAFVDKVQSTCLRLKNLPYPNIGLTVTGYIFSVIPFFNLLSIFFGGFLAFSNDKRAQLNGILMISIAIAVILISRLF
ncbi:MAG: hypothetical protein ACTSWN_12035 [Promethearchaeota archaeon]